MSFGGGPKNPPWQRNTLGNAGQQQMQQISNLQTQIGLINPQIVGFQQQQQQNQPFQQNLGMQQVQQQQQQQQQNLSILSQMGGNIGNQMQQNQIFTQAVTYPAPRALNPIAFQNTAVQQPPPQHPPPQLAQHMAQQQQQQHQQNQHLHQQMQQLQGAAALRGQQQQQQTQLMTSQSTTHSNLQSNLNKNIRVHSGTGIVTKMQTDFGFIDDEIYFHKNVCVKGVIPRVGDRVLVEANYNPAMTFKWTATRIQFLSPAGATPLMAQKTYPSLMAGSQPMQKSSSGAGGGGYSAVPPPHLSSSSRGGDNDNRDRHRHRDVSPPPRRSSPDRHRSRDSRKEISNNDDELDRKRRREEREKERERYRERREHSTEKRDRSPVVRRSSPKRRKTRAVPRYMVQMPKVNLTMSDADVLELRRRYTNLYIPSDFFFTQISWVKAFPPNLPFSIQKPCSFIIMHKDVVNPYELSEEEADPIDADYLFSAKVMLMGVPQMSEIYSKCFATAEEKDRDDDGRDFVHPTRLINFLVGFRGRNETMAIGGPWSKSLDGENPESDSSVLIRTAIRNCRALTGIDLSRCTQWYRFVELYYRRSETIHKGRVIPARIETVVIFLPDVRSCIPTLLEWDTVHSIYKKTLENVLNRTENRSDVSGGATVTASGQQISTPTVAISSSSSSSIKSINNNQNDGDDDDVVVLVGGSIGVVEEDKSSSSTSNLLQPATSLDSSDGDIINTTTTTSSSSPLSSIAVENVDVVVPTVDSSAGDPGSVTNLINDESEEVSNAIVLSAVGETEDGGIPFWSDKDENTESDATVTQSEQTELPSPTRGVGANVLDPKSMKVPDLKDELIARNLSPKGLKAQLVARLSKALKTESENAINNPSAVVDTTVKDGRASTTVNDGEKQCDADEIMMDAENDLKDMVVIDEYDSTKVTNTTASSTNTSTKDKEKRNSDSTSRVIDDRERYYLEKHYTLPSTPHIIVHPSRSAKSGNFNCTVMSLSLLLDYRRDDTKEHSFEISLFAELFNEMLMRDFGFNIYKALYAMPDKAKEVVGDQNKNGTTGDDDNNKGPTKSKKDDGGGKDSMKKGTEADVDNEVVELVSSSTKVSENSSSKDDDEKSTSKRGDRRDRDRDRDRDDKEHRDRKSRRGQSPYRVEECSDDDSYSTKSANERQRRKSDREPREAEKEKRVERSEKDRNKYYTANLDLLLSFVYFDQTHCGYIFEKDIEDLFYTLGLNLSRAQTRKLVGKVISRDSLYYRKLTDLPRTDESTSGDGVVDDSRGEKTTAETDATFTLEIAKGNKFYMPVFKVIDATEPAKDNVETEKIAMETDDNVGLQQQSVDKKDVLETTSGMVIYKGGLIDLDKLIDQMKRSEKAREDTEQLLVEVRKQNTEANVSLTKSQTKIKDLSFDLKNCYKILGEAESSLSSTQKKVNEYSSIIATIYDKVAPIVLKSDKNSRHETSRDTHKDREKDRDGANSKDKERMEFSEPSASKGDADDVKKEK